MRFRFENLVLDAGRRELLRNGAPMAVEPQVFDLLLYLVENRDRVVSKDDVLNAVWHGRIVSESTLTTRINAARKALGDSGEVQRLIRTLPRKGFRFVGEVKDDQAPTVHEPARLAPEPGFPLALPDRPSIAVLPFQNLSSDPEQEYFADGLSEDIIATLSRSRDFFVIARNSSFSYKGKSPDVRQVGRELGVRYVLEGGVRKAGNRLRITAQLIDAATGNHHWAERYECEATDIFAIQDEITEKVVASIEPQLLLAEGEVAKHKTPTDLNAWGYVARSYVHLAAGSRDDLQIAISLLERAVECDSRHAPAHANLAQVHMLMAYRGWVADRDRAFEVAEASARRAIELDATDPLSHFARGMVASLRRQHVEALASLTKAVELNPNFAIAHSRLGTMLAFLGRAEQGIEHTSRALRISPRDPQRFALLNMHAIALFAAGKYAEAISPAQTASQERAGYAQALRMLTAARALHGDMAGARTALRDLQLAQPGITLTWVDKNVDAPDAVRPHLLEGLRLAGMPE